MFGFFPKTQQLDAMDCGPACLQIISKYYGKHFSLQELRNLCNVTKEGASVYDVCKGAETIGYKTLPVKTSFKWLEEKVPLPCIVHWQNHHFVVVYKIKNRKVWVSDPALGLIEYTKEEFIRGWFGHLNIKNAWRNGVGIVLEPTNEFKDVKPKKGKASNLDLFQFLISYLSTYKGQAFKLIGIMLLIALMQSAFPVITQSVVDVGISSKDLSFIHLLVIANVVLVISTSLGNWVRQSLNMHISTRIKILMLSNYIIKLLKLPMSFFESKLTGDIMQRITDHERLESFMMKSGFGIILAIFNLVVFGTILLLYDSILFWVFFVGSVLYVGWILLFWNIRKRMDLTHFSLLSKTQSQWIEMLSNIEDIKNNNYETAKRWKWEKIQIRLYRVGVKLLNIGQLQMTGGNLINSLRDVALMYLSALAVISGEMTLGMMIAIQYIIGQLKGPVAEIIQFISSYQLAFISFIRMNEIQQIDNEQSEEQSKNLIFPRDKSLSLKGIGFKYNSTSPYILKNISIKIPENKVTAIVGLSGSGKSSLMKIILRLYKPLIGEFKIGGQNAESISLSLWRDKIGVVTQESDVFNDTILNNIILGEHELDKDKLYNAVELAHIKKEIETLPAGYNTFMGENGKGMSEGQKQRILIARALYKDPEYLILDEATSGLDFISEKLIVDNLKSLRKTTIITSHRITAIKNADYVIFINEGRVVESGSYKDLIDKQGYFYNIFKSQML